MKTYNRIIPNFKKTKFNQENVISFFQPLIEKLEHKQQIKFAFFCATTVRSSQQECAELVKLWLKSPDLVENHQLKFAADNAAKLADWAISNVAFAIVNKSVIFANLAVSNSMLSLKNRREAIDVFTLYLDILTNNTKYYLVPDKTLIDFAKQDIDKLDSTDINMILDYVKENHDLDLTELTIHNRILAEFIRSQI